jgi:hypothetical protein
MPGQNNRITSGTTADVGNNESGAKVIHEAQRPERRLGTAWPMPFQIGEIFEYKINIEFVDRFIFFAHYLICLRHTLENITMLPFIILLKNRTGTIDKKKKAQCGVQGEVAMEAIKERETVVVSSTLDITGPNMEHCVPTRTIVVASI